MKITDLLLDGTECELSFGIDGKLYLVSNFGNLQGVLKNYKWEDAGCYGQCFLEITKAELLALVMCEINDICNTQFSLEFISVKPSTIRHQNDNIEDIVFKSNNKEMYKFRLVINEQNEYPNECMKQREKEFILKISSIIYWICWNKAFNKEM